MADEQTLDDVQALITKKYLGQAGIHGVGVRRKKSAIALYVEPGTPEEHKDLLTQITDEVMRQLDRRLVSACERVGKI